MGAVGEDLRRGAKQMISTTAQAKINLTLEVLRKRPDSYHEIRSVVQTINFLDKLNFHPSSRLEFTCSLPEWSAEKSLVFKAAELLYSTTGAKLGAYIEIEKRIPLSSGLGGDSSDAAAVLRGLNLLWKLELSLRDLIKIGAQLGSDVILFLYGGTLLMEGRGEKIRALPSMPHLNIILLMPAIDRVENKTRQMYGRLTPSDFSDGKASDKLVKILESAGEYPETRVYNVFEKQAASFFKGLKQSSLKFHQAGATSVHLAGSGPTLFSLIKEDNEAAGIHKRLREMGQEAYLVKS
jgi:4-diphosphocytidyl-2-C-methyl-D-erythritol kinase